MTEWVVVMRFAVEGDRAVGLTEALPSLARLLGSQPGCRGVEVGRASDDPSLWAMTSRWTSVGAYRTALSQYDVKVNAVPLMSRAIDEPTAFEVLFAVDADGERSASGDLAGDASTFDRSR
ncbi:MAG TPA: antibiotic biosynthesis monooxygenase family protein [Actinomycetes bacterium]|nr:antibiotic biosynthesis monooxygenase family protein [Actinomycetes bacterium]